MTNCKNCGAVLTDNVCEYCGTLYYDFSNMVNGKPSYFRIKDERLGMLDVKAIPSLNCLTMATDEHATIELELTILEMKKGGE